MDRHEIWDLIERSNAAWLAGNPEETAFLFAANARLVAPGLAATIEGRDAIVQTYAEMVATTTTERFEITDRSLSIDDRVAVAAYVFEISYQAADQRYHERGQEILVLRNDGNRWLVTWRTQISLPVDQ